MATDDVNRNIEHDEISKTGSVPSKTSPGKIISILPTETLTGQTAGPSVVIAAVVSYGISKGSSCIFM